VEKIAEHYGRHPSIIGWQIDNEINCGTDEFYSESDTIMFREFLKSRYGSLEALNEAWGTVFWNQTYTNWAEVFVPRTTIGNATNPHHVLDYIRFVSHSAREYVKLQSDILRKYIKNGDFITTNGIFNSLDNHQMNKESLDFYTYDSYPNFAYSQGNDVLHSTDLNDRKWARKLVEVRSVSPKKFGVMEQQSGPGGWNTRMVQPAPRPGQITLWTLQDIAHGADYVSYFRWRTCAFGTEIYWHGILDYSNRDNSRIAEVKDIKKKLDALYPVAGSSYEAAFAVARDYDNLWDARLDIWHNRVESESETGIFQASQLTHTPMDYVYLGHVTLQELAKYPLIIYPHGIILTEENARILEQYVAQGGKLVLGCRTGYKDIHGRCPMVKLPGLLRQLSGTDVLEYTFVAPDEKKVLVQWDGDEIEAAVFNDILAPLGDAKLAGTYTTGSYAGKGALVENTHGKGKVYYFGGTFTRETTAVFLKKLGVVSPYKDLIEAPPECELASRKGKDGRTYLFVLNYTAKPVVVNLKKEALDLYSAKPVSGSLELPPYGTAGYAIG
jgi:beta-galactosidase